MALVSTFNAMLMEFVEELTQTFPEEKAFSGVKSKLHIASTLDPTKPVALFVDNIAPHVHRVQAEDETLFAEMSLFDLSMADAWKSATPTTKKAIFQHLQNLYLVGSAIRGIPKDVLSNIESIAERCTRDMDVESSGPDTGAGIMDAVGKVMAGIMSDPNMRNALLPGPGAN